MSMINAWNHNYYDFIKKKIEKNLKIIYQAHLSVNELLSSILGSGSSLDSFCKTSISQKWSQLEVKSVRQEVVKHTPKSFTRIKRSFQKNNNNNIIKYIYSF